MTPLLHQADLHITIATPAGQVQAVLGGDLELHDGETLAIVGESGCGKSVLCRSSQLLLQDNARSSGRILLEGRDIMVQSRTGSGKTGCYLLPLVPRLDPELHAAQALILVPTRELAVQVEHEALTLFEGTGIRPVAGYGGVGYKKQMDALRDGAQLVVGTPGRVLDHLLRRTLSLDDLDALAPAQADRL